jgi:hypothetical protein
MLHASAMVDLLTADEKAPGIRHRLSGRLASTGAVCSTGSADPWRCPARACAHHRRNVLCASAMTAMLAVRVLTLKWGGFSPATA